ncbi:MAG: hypothetical protein U9N85_12570 [Bacteroidota bacterium]|nr:hypothetical protein [Bacteroidota bacterium]
MKDILLKLLEVEHVVLQTTCSVSEHAAGYRKHRASPKADNRKN